MKRNDDQRPRQPRLGQLRRVQLPTKRRDFPGSDILLTLLDRIEDQQERMRLLDHQLADFLANGYDPDYGYDDDEEVEIDPVDVVTLGKGWHAFLRAGGVTGDDLRAFLRGEPLGPDVKVKHHLRLVRSNPRWLPRVRITGGDHAA